MSLRQLDAPKAGHVYGCDIDALTKMGFEKAANLFSKLQRVKEWNEEGPVLSRALRQHLANFDNALARPKVVGRERSSDGSTRYLLQTHDGHIFETVHMPREVKHARVTLCLSSQVGCAMGCTFCATGKMGLLRNLSAGEIVAQVLSVLHASGALHGDALSLVFMGMGEPLHNLDEVQKAIKVLTSSRGLDIPAARITVSTSGLVQGIKRLATFTPRPRLAVSINATTDDKRAAIMPIAKKHNLAALKDALMKYPQGKKDRITLEYVLLAGENDSEEDAERLADFAKGLYAHVNVIPLNEHEDNRAHRRTNDECLMRFYDALKKRGLLVFVRHSRGQDVSAACGQLAQTQRRENEVSA